ncbi:MAG: hypothetical protein PVF77_10570 [Anaerolineae bacterium]|jgi:hypothetical protein
MTAEPQAASHQISTLNEKPLHAALKSWYAEPGDQLEVDLEGYVIDIVRRELLIEIQTASFSSIKRKLIDLTARHPVRLVYPVAREKWIVKLASDGHSQQSRRKSPKRGTVEDLFRELVSFPRLLAHPSFSLEVLLIQEDEVRRYDGKRAWRRRGWVTHERRLLQVLERRVFETPADMGRLLPDSLADPFTTSDLAAALGKPLRLAQRMAYCLREMGVITREGKRRNAILYARARV